MDEHKLLAQLTLHEGLRLSPYTDTVGKLTIGIGHNLTDLGISPSIAQAIYAEDRERVVSQLMNHFPWWAGLDDIRQRIFVDLCFNLGISRLLGFKDTLAASAKGDWTLASRCLTQSLWYRQVGTRGARLVKMLETGQDPPELQ